VQKPLQMALGAEFVKGKVPAHGCSLSLLLAASLLFSTQTNAAPAADTFDSSAFTRVLPL